MKNLRQVLTIGMGLFVSVAVPSWAQDQVKVPDPSGTPSVITDATPMTVQQVQASNQSMQDALRVMQVSRRFKCPCCSYA